MDNSDLRLGASAATAGDRTTAGGNATAGAFLDVLSWRCIAARPPLPGAAVVTEGCLETGLEVGREVLLTEGCRDGPVAGVFAADVTDACLETGWDTGGIAAPLVIEVCLDGTLPVSVRDRLETG